MTVPVRPERRPLPRELGRRLRRTLPRAYSALRPLESRGAGSSSSCVRVTGVAILTQVGASRRDDRAPGRAGRGSTVHFRRRRPSTHHVSPATIRCRSRARAGARHRVHRHDRRRPALDAPPGRRRTPPPATGSRMTVRSGVASPATVQVVQHAFISGAEQMRRNLYRSAYSPVIYEIKDCSVGLYDAHGQLLGQAPGLPFFLGSLGGSIQAVIDLKGSRRSPRATSGSSTTPPSAAATSTTPPCSCRSSATANCAGSAAPRRTGTTSERRSPATSPTPSTSSRKACASRRRACGTRACSTSRLLDLIAFNSRFPDALVGDLMAEVAACRTGRGALPLDRRAGTGGRPSTLRSRTTSHRPRPTIAIGRGDPRRRLQAAGACSTATASMTTSRQGGRHRHASTATRWRSTSTGSERAVTRAASTRGLVQTRSAIQQAFKFLVNPDSPASAAARFRNLEIVIPPGSCFDPGPEAAFLHYGPHLMLAMDLVVKALSEAVPDRAAAGHVGDSWNVSLTNARRTAGVRVRRVARPEAGAATRMVTVRAP